MIQNLTELESIQKKRGSIVPNSAHLQQETPEYLPLYEASKVH